MDEAPKTDDQQPVAPPQGDPGAMPPTPPGGDMPEEGAPEEAPKEDGDKPAGGAW